MATCDLCEKDRCSSAMKFKDKWICNMCIDELYPHFKSHYHVKRVNIISNRIDKWLDSQIPKTVRKEK